MKLGDLLVRSLNEHPAVSIVLFVALWGMLHSAARLLDGNK